MVSGWGVMNEKLLSKKSEFVELYTVIVPPTRLSYSSFHTKTHLRRPKTGKDSTKWVVF